MDPQTLLPAFSLLLASALAAPVFAQTPSLEQASGLKGLNVEVVATTYKGRAATRLTPRLASPAVANGEGMALLSGPGFENGTIELDVAGRLGAGASPTARGFIGLAFDVSPDALRFKAFYLRPTNGRADDQLRRNHSTQYISMPEHPWERLRSEEPGVYESYVDLEEGAWTHMRIVVEGGKARLHVNGADQPCLIVNDLKHAARGGALALWIGAGTEGYFANLKVERR